MMARGFAMWLCESQRQKPHSMPEICQKCLWSKTPLKPSSGHLLSQWARRFDQQRVKQPVPLINAL